MTSEEVAWVAGLLEGEGYFGYSQPHKKRCPKIIMETKDRDVAERLKTTVQCGQVNFRKAKKPQHSDTYVFAITRSADAVAVMGAVYPLMGQRRADRINEVLGNYDG